MEKEIRENIDLVRYHVQLQHRYSALGALDKLEERLGGSERPKPQSSTQGKKASSSKK